MVEIGKKKVLLIGDLDESLPEFIQFKEKFEILHYRLTKKEEFITKLSNEFKDISAIFASWLGFSPLGGLTKDIIDEFPPSLKIISITPVGYDPYDVNALKGKGIALYNSPSLGAESVADTVLWHVLESFRLYSTFQTNTRLYGNTIDARGFLQNNPWDAKRGQVVENDGRVEINVERYPFGEIAGDGVQVHQPRGKNVGIVGFGKIGQAVGKRLNAIGLNVKYNQRNELSNDTLTTLGYQVEYFQKLQDLVDVSDVIVLSLPGNAKTKGLISREIIDSFKKGVKLINVGRAFLIDNEDYIVDKLEKGDISFFGLDVFDGEPNINPRLLSRLDVAVTPHIGSSTKENFDATAIFALRNIEAVLEGRDGESRVV